MTSDRATGQGRDDGQKAAKRKPAVSVGDGTVSAETTRTLTTFPPNQRTSDSHDYTRLTVLKVLFIETGTWFIAHAVANRVRNAA